MIRANTTMTHWTFMNDSANAFLPNDRIYTVAPYRKGLWLTTRLTVDGYDLIGRVISAARSAFGKSLAEALERYYGGTVREVTVVVRHKILPESEGREGLHQAITADAGDLDWDSYDVDIYEAVGEGLEKWPVMTFQVVTNTYEMNEYHLKVNQTDELAAGILLCEEKEGVQIWYRRPFQYQMVGTFTRMDQSGKLFVEWTDDNGQTYSGFFVRGQKRIVDDLIERNEGGKGLIGRKVRITFQARNMIRPNFWRLYNVRFEHLMTPNDSIGEQLALTFY